MSNAVASTSALSAFTESAQRNGSITKKKLSKAKAAKAKEKPKTTKVLSALADARSTFTTSKRNPDRKTVVSFDDDARREYLTGFQKRKTERKEAARKVIEERKKQEARELRTVARQERAKRAEENVKAERVALGLESEDEDGADAGGQDGEGMAEVERPAPTEFESEEQQTVVTIESFDPDDPLGIDSRPTPISLDPTASEDRNAEKRQRIVDRIPASSRRAMKKASKEQVGSSSSSSGGGGNKKGGQLQRKSRSSSSTRGGRGGRGGGRGGSGAGRLPQRKQAARGLSTMLASSSKKARAVS
ncbi:unnamed protein product [Tilletia controversa]|nr:unnamed protein product [Tilletia controversa]CAD6979263.1 unnamed protein product [Tilletia controversa]